tara:strand:- start:1712 stop:1951 length:240 start_codon:yes stop_codon:yes gene_type:complete
MLKPRRRKRTYRPKRIKYIKSNFVFTQNEIQNVINIYKEKRETEIRNKSRFIESEDFLQTKKKNYGLYKKQAKGKTLPT